MSDIQISETEWNSYLAIIDSAMAVLQDTIDDSEEQETINTLRVGFGMGRSLELMNMVRTELFRKSAITNEEQTND